MKRITTYAGAVAAAAITLIFVREPISVGLLTGVATGLLIPIIDLWASSPHGTNVLWATVRYRERDIRVSISYLIRIERSGKYLLMRGERYPDQFQPVGGVYKFNPSALPTFTKWNVRTDDLIPVDSTSVDDLRVRVKGRHLTALLGWFESGQGREQGALREFYEELVAGGTYPANQLAGLRFDFRRRHINRLRYSAYAQSQELLVADIFDLICSPSQLVAIDSMVQAEPNRFIWADAGRIERLGAIPGQIASEKIALPAQWLI